ncbi:uncharacterized protein TNCV_1611671 [Trichonephila clavipes]|nr:uncharacterized protein TNCV_1611671 [Trichonephila clavipes]
MDQYRSAARGLRITALDKSDPHSPEAITDLFRYRYNSNAVVTLVRVRGFYANQSQRTRQFFKIDENLVSKIQSLKYRIQQLYSENKSQKVFTPSTALKHNYRCLKCTYIKDYSQAIARSTAEKNPEGLKLAKNDHQHDRQSGRQITHLVAKIDVNLALLPRFRQVPIESPL